MEFWAIAYKYEESIFYDFKKQGLTHNFSEACFLPSEELANQLIEDEFGNEAVAVKVELNSLSESGVWTYSVGKVAEWEHGGH